jgi:hypothetical protein
MSDTTNVTPEYTLPKPRREKAHGHILQADWDQPDPLHMSYIHNKPDVVEKAYVERNFIKATLTETVHVDCGDASEFIEANPEEENTPAEA